MAQQKRDVPPRQTLAVHLHLKDSSSLEDDKVAELHSSV